MSVCPIRISKKRKVCLNYKHNEDRDNCAFYHKAECRVKEFLAAEQDKVAGNTKPKKDIYLEYDKITNMPHGE